MKSWLLACLLLSAGLPGWRWLMQVQNYNTAQAQGQVAATFGRPAEAVYYYQQAVALAGRGGPKPALLLALAQAQTQAGQAGAAQGTYAQLLGATVPAAIGSTARQQLALLLAQQKQFAQAISLLRQALKLNPANAPARYNYELLSQYLATQQPEATPPPSASPRPAPAPHLTPRDSTRQDNASKAPKPSEKAGADHAGKAPSPSQTPPASGSVAPQAATPGATGQPANQGPSPDAGSKAPGSYQPGQGTAQPLPSGTAPGRQRGLDANAAAKPSAAPASPRPGTEHAGEADLQLQTQRERLKAMDLTPAQAQQLLDALRESEQQYLQQRPRVRQGAPPAPGQPTW